MERAVNSLVIGVAGLIVLLVTPHVMRGLAAVDRALVRVLLGAERNGATPATGRGAGREPGSLGGRRGSGAPSHRAGPPRRRPAAAGRRRHGPRAGARSGWSGATTRPATAELVGHAHDEAKRAITELRELVRGIHPAVLADRGLDAALSSVAARCPVPVELSVDLPERPPRGRRGGRLLRGGRGAHERRQAQLRPPGVGARGPARADGRGRGHRRRRGGASVQQSGGLAGLADRVEGCRGHRAPAPAPTAGRPRCWWSSRAGPDRRGLGPAAGGPGTDPGRVRRRGGGRARHARTTSSRPSRPLRPTSSSPTSACPDAHGRGAAGRHRAPPPAAGHAGAGAVAIRRGALRQRAPVGATRRRSATS